MGTGLPIDLDAINIFAAIFTGFIWVLIGVVIVGVCRFFWGGGSVAPNIIDVAATVAWPLTLFYVVVGLTIRCVVVGLKAVENILRTLGKKSRKSGTKKSS